MFNYSSQKNRKKIKCMLRFKGLQANRGNVMNISKIIKEQQLQQLFKEGNFGIEKEGLRTDLNEKLVMTDHPHILGSRLYHPYLSTDFSEAQPEIITPVQPSLELAFNWLEALHDVLHRSMADDEYLWPNSMPNILPDEDDIPIIRYNDPDAVQYREYLAESYGKKKQTISGVHFNFSFTDAFIDALYTYSDANLTKIEFQNALYVKLAANFLRYEWVLLYLFGASPYADPTFYDSKSGRKLTKPDTYVRSLRNSSFGYHNHDEVVVNYETIKGYVEDIENYVATGHLSEEREFYGNARLRGKGSKLRNMLESGVQYIEFRSFDNNPLDRIGFSYDQGRFLHLFFMFMVWMDEHATTEDILNGQEKNLNTADEYPFNESAYKEEALEILDAMQNMLDDLSLNGEFEALISQVREKFEDPEKSLSARVAKEIEEEGYLAHGRKLGLEFKHFSTDRPYVLNGFEDMELSTQLLMYDAIELGVEVEITDRVDQFLKLSHEDTVEYVRNGNMTSKDTTISHFIMENKTVTKKILAEAGFKVPGGGEYHSIESAMNNYLKYKDQPIVVKPKSTNYGLGISVFKKFPSEESFKEALEIAFKEDDTVLVEEYISGTEYRFFVLNDKVGAVLLRVPANVTGDGVSTISQLIDTKNDDPLRGDNHRAPLAYIEKGSIEKLMLKEQGLDFDSVPEEGRTVYLRENSNISTGGDSIDFTSQMDESYNAIAVGIAKAIDVKVTGIDLIIPDYTKPSTSNEPGYSCIEANFNPAMNMHAYVTKGEGRRLSKGILEMLFPELVQQQEQLLELSK